MKCRQCQATLLYILCEKKILLDNILALLQHILNAAAVLFCCFLGLNGKQAPQLCISTTCSLAYSDGNEYALSRTPDMQYYHHMLLHCGMDTYFVVLHNTSKYSILLYAENTDRYICMQGKLYMQYTIGSQDEFWLMYRNIEYQKIFLEIYMNQRPMYRYLYSRCI